MDDVEMLVSELGGHVTRPSYRYMEESLRCSLTMEEFPRGRLTKVLYPMVALRFGMTDPQAPKTVSRAVARAVADAWEYGDREKIRQIAGGEWRGRPTPGEMLYYLRKEMLARRKAEEKEAEASKK